MTLCCRFGEAASGSGPRRAPAAQRKQQAHEGLKTVKERERAAKEEIAELQQSLSSSSSGSPSEASMDE